MQGKREAKAGLPKPTGGVKFAEEDGADSPAAKQQPLSLSALLPEPTFDKKNVPGTLSDAAIAAANKAFQAAFGPAYYAATHAYVVNRTKHPKDPSVASKASTQVIFMNRHTFAPA